MSSIWQVLIFSLIGGVFSLIGGIFLLRKSSKAETLLTYVTPFAAGALLSAAFLDLLKEAGESGKYEDGLIGALVGIMLFFFLERFFSWFHHHHPHEHGSTHDPKAKMIIIGDSLHNLIDGLAIGAAFLVSPEVGIISAIAVAAHEIPQEIGDFGLLLSKGMAKKKVLLVNLFSASLSTLSALFIFSVGQNWEINTAPLLGLVAGMFIYIAVSDVIPEIHASSTKKLVNLSAAMLVLGVVTVGLLSSSLHNYLEDKTEHEHHNHQHEESHDDDH